MGLRWSGYTFDPPQHEIVGFEGGWGSREGITYGCAAVVTKEHLHNLLLGYKSPIEKLDEYVESGSVTLLDRPIHVPVSETMSPFVMVVPNDHLVAGSCFGKGAICAMHQNGYHAYVYRSHEHLKEEGARVVREILRKINELTRTATVLEPHHPRIRSIQVALGKDNHAVHRLMGRASMRRPEDFELFDAIMGTSESKK